MKKAKLGIRLVMCLALFANIMLTGCGNRQDVMQAAENDSRVNETRSNDTIFETETENMVVAETQVFSTQKETEQITETMAEVTKPVETQKSTVKESTETPTESDDEQIRKQLLSDRYYFQASQWVVYEVYDFYEDGTGKFGRQEFGQEYKELGVFTYELKDKTLTIHKPDVYYVNKEGETGDIMSKAEDMVFNYFAPARRFYTEVTYQEVPSGNMVTENKPLKDYAILN